MNAGLLLSTFGPQAGKNGGWLDSSESLTSSVTSLNKIFTNVGIGIGALIIALAVLKLILSFSDQNSMSKMQASMMFGVGIFFLGIAKVVDVLSVTESTGVADIVSTILTKLLGPIFTYIGAIISVLAVFALIMSVMHENAEEQTKAQTLLAIGLACFGASNLMTALSWVVGRAISGEEGYDALSETVNIGVSLISGIAFYIGIFGLILYIFRLIVSIRTEEPRERDAAIKGLMVGIALVSFGGVLSLFGNFDSSYFSTTSGWSSVSAEESKTSGGSKTDTSYMLHNSDGSVVKTFSSYDEAYGYQQATGNFSGFITDSNNKKVTN